MYAVHHADTAFGPMARRAIRRVAEHTSLLLYTVLQAARHTEITAQLRRAIIERVIEQAMGIIMGQRRCTASEAFVLLRASSPTRNRRLRDVAADIIKVFTGRPPEPSPFTDSS
jgi:hypothetical protein